MTDQFSTTTSRNYFQRLGDSFVGILVGFVLLLIAVVLLFWNEGRAVDASRGLTAAAKAAVSVTGAQVLPANEGKLVYVTGTSATTAPIVHTPTGVAAPGALALVSKVEMFQWVETNETKTKDKVGGTQETTTTTTYTQKWHEGPLVSADFKRPEGHANPDMPIVSRRDVAVDAKLGGFALSSQVIDLLPSDSPFVPETAPTGWSKTATGLFKGTGTPDAPKVGDLKITYSIAPVGTMSAMGAQTGNQFTPWASGNGAFTVLLAAPLIQAKEAMVSDAKAAEGLLTWVLRVVGTIMCMIGFGLIMGPLKAIGNVIPFVASILGGATGLVAFGLGSILALIVIAVAWFVVRPILSLVLIAISVALVIGLAKMRKASSPSGAANMAA
jgi:Transmembrane protein 43